MSDNEYPQQIRFSYSISLFRAVTKSLGVMLVFSVFVLLAAIRSILSPVPTAKRRVTHARTRPPEDHEHFSPDINARLEKSCLMIAFPVWRVYRLPGIGFGYRERTAAIA